MQTDNAKNPEPISMLEKMLLHHCTPALFGLKQANLFSCPKNGALIAEIRDYNRLLNKTGVYIRVLYQCRNRLSILVYREKTLREYLGQKAVSEYLLENGYPEDCGQADYIPRAFCRLRKRMAECAFPHEIGFFLGYPVEDVFGFMTQNGRNFKCCGYWKVYGDEEEAMKIFSRYDKCREIISKKVVTGTPILKLLGIA